MITSLIITSIILIFLIFILSSKGLFDLITKKCDDFRDFIIKNNSFFTLFFMGLYFFEQALVVMVIYLFFNVTSTLQTFISIFALIVVTTATVEKFISSYKYQYLLIETRNITYENQMFLSDMKDLINENEKLRNNLKKKR
ncbi:MAG: hypothetical protein KKC75_04375 [Nanoarchaeota archaeon]|nr:hypothetical protein [Nanoarchaeota archaeon]MBU1005485.1 hypothetical protein [Nanoarchaeota archaeon]MBU1946829.1 hypothetical protein [Nanoarchaeota archaeon]